MYPSLNSAGHSASVPLNASTPLLVAGDVRGLAPSRSDNAVEFQVPDRVNAFYGLGQTLRGWADRARWPQMLGSAVVRVGQAVSDAMGALGAHLPSLHLPGAVAAPARQSTATRGPGSPAEAIFNALPNVRREDDGAGEGSAAAALRREQQEATRDALQGAVRQLAGEGPRTHLGLVQVLARQDGIMQVDTLPKLASMTNVAEADVGDLRVLVVPRGETERLEQGLMLTTMTSRPCPDSAAAAQALDQCVSRLRELERQAEQCVGMAAAPACAQPRALARQFESRSWPLVSCGESVKPVRLQTGESAYRHWDLAPRLDQPQVPRRVSVQIDEHCVAQPGKVTFGPAAGPIRQGQKLAGDDLNLVRMAHSLTMIEEGTITRPGASRQCVQADLTRVFVPERVIDRVCPEFAAHEQSGVNLATVGQPAASVRDRDREL